MAKNQLYGYSFRSSGGGGAAANLSSAGRYSSRSLPESFKSSEPSMLGSTRYLASSDLLSSSSSSPKLLFSHTDGYSVAVDRIPAVTVASPATSHMASYVSWPGPPGVDVGVGLTSAAGDILHSGLKRPASEGKASCFSSYSGLKTCLLILFTLFALASGLPDVNKMLKDYCPPESGGTFFPLYSRPQIENLFNGGTVTELIRRPI